jgi:hypothetical protein
MVIRDGVFADPVQRGHSGLLLRQVYRKRKEAVLYRKDSNWNLVPEEIASPTNGSQRHDPYSKKFVK